MGFIKNNISFNHRFRSSIQIEYATASHSWNTNKNLIL